MKSKEEIIQQLKEYFEQRDDIVMAFVFGSQAKGYARARSDWDVGIYFSPQSVQDPELEVDREYPESHRIWGDVEQIVGTDVDLVVLNRASATVAWAAMRGIPLVIKKRGVYLRFLLQVSHEANAWYDTAHDYYEVFQRSASLSEEDRERLERAVQFLDQEVNEYALFKNLTWKEYNSYRIKKRNVERWAEQLMNAAIDIAEIVLASERRVLPDNYRLLMRALGTIVPFDAYEDVYKEFAAWTELRNILAHEYLDYRWKELERFINETESLFHSLTQSLKEFLKK